MNRARSDHARLQQRLGKGGEAKTLPAANYMVSWVTKVLKGVFLLFLKKNYPAMLWYAFLSKDLIGWETEPTPVCDKAWLKSYIRNQSCPSDVAIQLL